MKKNFSSKKSAFSLIELSIVLIIIGLLIAGITGGASLIKSSELRSVMGEARGYAVAVNSFFTQYDQYPGDANILVGATTNVGDRDNQIEYLNDATTKVAEGLDAWFDLRDIGAVDHALTLAGINLPTAQIPGTNIPASKIRGAGWAFDYNTASAQNVVVLTGTTTLMDASNITSFTNHATVANNAANVIISAPDAFAIDTKVDDGVANAGNVRGVNKSTVNADACFATTAYTVANGAKRVCVLAFRVDVNS